MQQRSLERRLVDLERTTSPERGGVVVVVDGETMDAAMQRLGISIATRQHGLVFIPAKKEQQHAIT